MRTTTPGVQWGGEAELHFPGGKGRGGRGAGRGAAPAPPPCSHGEVNKRRAGCRLRSPGSWSSGDHGALGQLRVRLAAAGLARWPAAHVLGRCQTIAACGASCRPGKGVWRGPGCHRLPMEQVRMINVQRLLEAAEFLERRDRGNGWAPPPPPPPEPAHYCSAGGVRCGG